MKLREISELACLLCVWLLLEGASEAQLVTAVSAGNIHSLFLKNDGSLWAMGGNNNGQLGDGSFNNTNLPEQIVGSKVSMVAAGSWHSLFLKTDGSLWGMGFNRFGQLGDGTFSNPPQYSTNQP